jgi:hypothetical protein
VGFQNPRLPDCEHARKAPIASPDVENRYLIVSSARRKEFYVQCIFEKGDGQIFCEAASGFYEESKNFATPRQLAILAGLGFSTDSTNGNFTLNDRADDSKGLVRITRIYLEALVRVYGLTENDQLVFTAPLIEDGRNNPVGPSEEECLAKTSDRATLAVHRTLQPAGATYRIRAH